MSKECQDMINEMSMDELMNKSSKCSAEDINSAMRNSSSGMDAFYDEYEEAMDEYEEAMDEYDEVMDAFYDEYEEAMDEYEEAMDEYEEAMDEYDDWDW